jgi:hypothetical protein
MMQLLFTLKMSIISVLVSLETAKPKHLGVPSFCLNARVTQEGIFINRQRNIKLIQQAFF